MSDTFFAWIPEAAETRATADECILYDDAEAAAQDYYANHIAGDPPAPNGEGIEVYIADEAGAIHRFRVWHEIVYQVRSEELSGSRNG